MGLAIDKPKNSNSCPPAMVCDVLIPPFTFGGATVFTCVDNCTGLVTMKGKIYVGEYNMGTIVPFLLAPNYRPNRPISIGFTFEFKNTMPIPTIGTGIMDINTDGTFLFRFNDQWIAAQTGLSLPLSLTIIFDGLFFYKN